MSLMSDKVARIGAVVAVVVCGAAFGAVNNTWKAKDGVADGSYDDVGHWDQGRIPTTNDNLCVARSGLSQTITFPQGTISSWANWNLNSAAGLFITLDGRGTVFQQEAFDPDGTTTYDQWASGKFNNIMNLERNSGGAQLKKQGLQFTDFLCVLSNNFYAVLKQGTYDFSLNGGRTTLYTAQNNACGETWIEKGATVKWAPTTEWRSCLRTNAIHVCGGILTGTNLNHPTAEGYVNAAPLGRFETTLDVSNGGQVQFSNVQINNNEKLSCSNRTFRLVVRDTGSMFKTTGYLYNYYADFQLAVQGGTVDIGGTLCLDDNHSTTTGRVELTGGVLTYNQLVPRNKNQYGEAFLLADGGTIRAKKADTAWLADFTKAELGARGLVLDTDYAVTVGQSFVNAEGAAGKIVKTSSGALTLSGTASEFGSLELRGGSLVFANGAVAKTALTVVNDLKTPTLPASMAGQLTGLTLGDSETKGVFVAQPAATVQVNGPVSLVNADVALSGAFATGTTYTLLEGKGDLTAQGEAWGRIVVTEGYVSGQAYVFSSAYDGERDVTLFKMAVTSAAVYPKTVTANETQDEDLTYSPYDTLAVAVDETALYNYTAGLTCGLLTKGGTGWMKIASDAFNLYLGIELNDGTLAFAAPTTELDVPLTINKPNGATVVEVADDLVVRKMNVTSGAWIKHGPGALVIENDGAATMTLTATNGCVKKDSTPGGTTVRLGPGYAPPTTSYAGLTVAEGELVLRGTGPNAKFDLKHAVSVGMPTPDGTVAPKFVVDNCEAYTGNNSYHFMLQSNTKAMNDKANYFTTNVALIVTNKALMRVDTLCVGDNVNTMQCWPQMLVDDSVFYSGFKLQFHRADQPSYRPNYVFRNNALVLANFSDIAQTTSCGVEISGGVDFLCDHSVLARATSYTRTPTLSGLTVYLGGNGNSSRIEFRNGAEFWCSQLNAGAGTAKINVSFDDADWVFDTGTNMCLSGRNRVTLNVKSGGLRARVTSSKPMRIRQPFTGAGEIVKTGTGTLWFDTQATLSDGAAVEYADVPATLACAGVRVTEGEGAVKISAGALRNGAYVTGSGTIVDSSFTTPCTIRLDVTETEGIWSAAAVPTFENCTFATGVRHVVSLAADVPLVSPHQTGVLVARYVGTAPDVSNWKLANSGIRNCRGKFTAANGEIRMDADLSGMLILLR